jgi:hypothetical protein
MLKACAFWAEDVGEGRTMACAVAKGEDLQ